MVNIAMKMNPLTGRERATDADFDEGRKVVRVLPKNEQIRKYLKHHPSRVGFLAEGSAEWPNDVFTKRRIADGDVSIAPAEPAAGEQKVLEQKAAEPKAIDKSGAKAANPKPTE
jgi:hypothetical protein